MTVRQPWWPKARRTGGHNASSLHQMNGLVANVVKFGDFTEKSESLASLEELPIWARRAAPSRVAGVWTCSEAAPFR